MATPLKVLIIQAELPEYRAPVFGALAALPDLDVTVAFCRGSMTKNSAASLNAVNVDCMCVGPFRWHRDLLDKIRDCDVVVAMLDPRWLSCVFAALRYPEKALVWGHGFGRSSLANRVRLFIARRSAGVLLYEEKARDAFLRAGVPADQVFIMGNTVNVDNPARAAAERSRFLYVGRLQKRKRIDLLLKAFAKAQTSLPPGVGITIVGNGSIRQELASCAERLGICDRVEFTGSIYDDETLNAQFARAIAYVSPGDVGLGVLQAFGHGVPVVTSQSQTHGPEFENILAEYNGIVCDGGEDQLSDVLIRLCREPNVTDAMGLNALAHYREKRTVAQMVERFGNAIRYVASRPVGKAGTGDRPPLRGEQAPS